MIDFKQAALHYHAFPRPGKISIELSKSADSAAYDQQAERLARLFNDNMVKFNAAPAIVGAGPRTNFPSFQNND